MTSKVLTAREGRAGVITLNRPEAINALDLEMIEAISAALQDFFTDDAIKLVLFEGNGPRGFCAGGDMRAIRQQVLDGDLDGPEEFFAKEYAMDLRIAQADKPVVALTHGVVMGGGIGIAGHAHFRISMPSGRFAMPEAAIGFHCDVGANAILAMTEKHRALAFCMAGDAVDVDVALGLGLTDCAIDTDARDDVRADLIAAADADDVPHALTSVMQSHATIPAQSGFLDMVDGLAPAFSGESASEIVDALTELAEHNAGAEKLLASIRHRCPTSLEAIYQALMAARAGRDVADILEREKRLSRWMIARPDFAEGVRAVLVDKDRAPVWQPDRLEKVEIAKIRAITGR